MDPGQPFLDEENKLATSQEDLEHKLRPDGTKLPIFTVNNRCVCQETCVADDGVFKIDRDGAFNNACEKRAIVVRQPATDEEVELFRHYVEECPVKAIVEVPGDPA